MSKRMDPRQQFSKKLARWTSVFWFLYMTWLSGVMLYIPEAALYCVYMGIICTIVMMINVVSYSANSIQEKILLALIDKTRLELKLGGTENDDEPEEEEGGSNG